MSKVRKVHLQCEACEKQSASAHCTNCKVLPFTDDGCLWTVPEESLKVDPVELEQVMGVLTAGDNLPDNVTLPHHYARFKIEPIRFSIENNLNGFQFNIVKYILRHDAKNGIEDLKKAKRYLEMFIKFMEGDEDWWKA